MNWYCAIRAARLNYLREKYPDRREEQVRTE